MGDGTQSIECAKEPDANDMSEVDFKPSGPVRPNTLYTSWRLHKALGYVARKTGRTREDLAEVVLSTWVAQEHPEIEEWIKQRESDEETFLKKLKPVPFT